MKTPSMIPVSKLKNPGPRDTDGILPVNMVQTGKWDLTIQDTESRRYTIRDIFRQNFDEYLRSHDVPFHKERAVRAIMACGTGELGYTLSTCEECGTITMHADSCGNRNCPSCGYPKQEKWIRERNAELLDGVPYVHVVFTLPHDLNALIYSNQKVLLNHLFRTVKKSVLDLCMEKYNLIPGLLMVLHTFSSNLSLHYHIHMLATAAGLSPDKTSFHNFGTDGYFLPVNQLKARYRNNFMQGLKDFREAGKLVFTGESSGLKNVYEWNELLNLCYEKDWNIEVRKYQVYKNESEKSGTGLTASNFPGYAIHPPVSAEAVHYSGASAELQEVSPGAEVPDVCAVTDYVSQYAFRTAISDNRIRSCNGETVTFDYKEYHDGNCIRKTMELKVHEFIRRFLLHILEPGIQRIRYAGFLASCIRKKTLSLIREILGVEAQIDPLSGMNLAELVKYFTGVDPTACPVCSGKTHINGHRIKIRKLAAQFVNSCFMSSS